MKYGSITALSAALLFAAAIALPAFAQSSGTTPTREYGGNSSNSPQSVKDKPTTGGGMSLHEATGGLVGKPRTAEPAASTAPASTPGAAASSSSPQSAAPSGTPMGKSAKKGVSAASSAKVKAAQEALNRSGANITADGKMGPKTRAAIRAYQQKNGLSATGTLNAQTMQKLGVS